MPLFPVWGVLLLTHLLLPTGAHGQSSPPPLQAGDLPKIRTIQSVALSPSGRNVAYTVRASVDRPSGDRAHRTRLYVAPTYGRAAPRLLTRTGRSASSPAWHPDGDRLAFVRPVDGTPQIFLLSLNGGEPYQLTHLPHGATQPRWSPNGRQILFSSTVPEPTLKRYLRKTPPSPRPARTAQDTLRRRPPKSILVLRDARTLDPVDTLALDSANRLRPSDDASRTLRSPPGRSVPDSLRPGLRLDSLRALSPDSLRTLFERLRMLPDTMQVPVAPDTAATPDGDLLQRRRWLAQRPSSQAKVFTRSRLDTSTPTYHHYFLVDVPKTALRAAPSPPSPRLVTKGFRSFRGGTWLPGGSQIVVSARPSATDASARFPERSLYVVDLSPYRLTRLLHIDGYALSTPRVTQDGTTLAFRAQSLTAPSYDHAEIGLFELDGRSNPKIITGSFDHEIGSYRWSPDGWYLYVTAPARGGRPLYRFAPFDQSGATGNSERRTSLQNDYSTSRDTFSLDTTMVRSAVYDRVLPPSRAVQDVDVTDSKAVYATLTPKNPSELYTNTISFNNERRVSSLNTGWTRPRYFRSSTWIEGWNGTVPVHGRLTPPSRSSDTTRAPLVVLPRGGPTALSSPDALSDWIERQYLSGQGYGVLEVWPRGSTGFGESVRRRNFQDWGPGPAGDVLALADSALTRPWADSTAQVIAGRGYGGTLTAWLLGHTDRFRAAVAQSGVYDLAAFSGSSSAGTLIADQFGGAPWTTTPPPTTPTVRPDPLFAAGLLPSPDAAQRSPRKALRQSSPLNAAHRIDTPLLLLHGGADDVTGPAQAEMLYRSLNRRQHPVEYVRYPGVGHDFDTASPAQRVDRLLRLHEFLSRYVTPTPQPRQ